MCLVTDTTAAAVAYRRKIISDLEKVREKKLCVKTKALSFVRGPLGSAKTYFFSLEFSTAVCVYECVCVRLWLIHTRKQSVNKFGNAI